MRKLRAIILSRDEKKERERERSPAASRLDVKARSKFHFNLEIPRHIMATLPPPPSLSHSLSLSRFQPPFFRDAPRAITNTSDAENRRREERDDDDDVGIQRRTRVSVIVIWMLIG